MLVYDRWGWYGRPVLLLHGLLFDRTMWWPVAAELTTATSCTVIAPDLPAHGDSPAREDHDPGKLAHDLGQLVHKLDLHRAPIVVGHGESAALATAFGERFAVHEVLTVDDLGSGRAEIPEHYRPYARARADPELLTAYEKWPHRPPTWPHLADPRAFAAGLRARLAPKG
ncbi:alpha/beta fold hydrolase [Actinoplanes sp. NPDC051411]|uniref:alpha/beta fold hydrolase n=1 Tax=Actinoplanes sp. NPDC051411 TaxID=3155522 RepID=UPI00342E9EB5